MKKIKYFLLIAIAVLFCLPIFATSWDEYVISAQRFENNLNNDISGGMTWTFSGTGSAPFSDAVYKNGAYSSGRWSTDDNRFYGNVTVLPKTIEFWLYWPTGHEDINRYVFKNNNIAMQCDSGGCRVWTAIPNQWTSFATINSDTWYHMEITNSGSHLIYKVNGTTIDEYDCTSNFGTGIYFFANFHTIENVAFDGYLDDLILSSIVRTTFPTEPLPTPTNTPTPEMTPTITPTPSATPTVTPTPTPTPWPEYYLNNRGSKDSHYTGKKTRWVDKKLNEIRNKK